MKTCQVCGRLYAGYQCPCRKRQHSKPRRSTGSGGGRRWRYAAREARVLGELPVDAAAAPGGAEDGGAAPELCARCGTVLMDGRCPACWERWAAEMAAGEQAGDVNPGELPDGDFCPES